MTVQGENLTVAIVSYRKNRLNNRLVFGTPALRIRRGWRREFLGFRGGDIFGYERWRADHYGTQDWRIYICQAVNSQQSITKVPGINPGAILLAKALGKTRSKRMLSFIDDLKSHYGNDLNGISEARWRMIGNSLETGKTPTIGRTVNV